MEKHITHLFFTTPCYITIVPIVHQNNQGSERLNTLSKAQESKVTVVNGGDCPEKGSGQECPKPKRPTKLTKNAKDPFTLGKSQAQTAMR